MNPGEKLPDPDQFPNTDVVIYDGNCQFCLAQVLRLARIDSLGQRGLGGFLGYREPRLSFVSLHDPRVAQRFPDLSHDQLMEQMYLVKEGGGRRYGGADAVRYLSRRLPPLWPAMPILHFPGTAAIWRWMYGQVAKQRYRWNKDACGEGGCAVHFGKPKQSSGTGSG